MEPINPHPEVTKRIEREIQNVSGKRIQDFRLIRAKQGVYVYKCLYDGIPAVAKHFENEVDWREILNYRILIQHGIPTLRVLAFGESTLVLEDIDRSEDWRLGIAEDLGDAEVAKGLARWYFAFHEKGADIPERDTLYFEYDAITKEKLETLQEKLPAAAALLAAYKAFEAEYGRLYFQKHGHDRQTEEDMERRIDEVAAPLFSLIAAFEQERFPAWAESAKAEALNGLLLSRARQLLA